MKKANVFLAIGAVLLLIACCSAAGCIGEDSSIVGTWKNTNSASEMNNLCLFSDGSAQTVGVDKSGVTIIRALTGWENAGNNAYLIDDKPAYLSTNGKNLTWYSSSGPQYFRKP